MARLPENAFDVYVSLGPERSHRAVAEHFGVSKRTVTKRAMNENWTDKLLKIQLDVRSRADERIMENLDDMNLRHLESLWAVQRKALERLRKLDFKTAAECARAIEASIKMERVVRGESSGRVSLDIDKTIRRGTSDKARPLAQSEYPRTLEDY